VSCAAADINRQGRGVKRQPLEIVDGRIVNPRLAVQIVDHCNLRCRSCNHLSPVLSAHRADMAEIIAVVERLSQHYHADRVSLLGGEPLLHPQLPEIVAAVRESGIGKRIVVVTNGRLLLRMGADFWREVDAVEVSLYPGCEPNERELHTWAHRAATSGTEMVMVRHPEFRETYSEIGPEDPSLIGDIFDTCQMAHDWRCHHLVSGRLHRCPPSAFLPRILANLSSSEHDSVDVLGAADLAAELRAMLLADSPLDACTHCLGTVGRWFSSEQIPRTEFRQRQREPSERLVDRERLSALLAGQPLRDQQINRPQLSARLS
jgi:hypothetical protein